MYIYTCVCACVCVCVSAADRILLYEVENEERVDMGMFHKLDLIYRDSEKKTIYPCADIPEVYEAWRG